MENTLQAILISHSSAYPEMELQDYIKLIYQNEFGSGHMISNTADSESYLRSEYETARAGAGLPEKQPFVETIGNGLCRMYLQASGVKPDFLPLLNLLFAATANTRRGSVSEFKKKAFLLHEMAVKNLLPLKAEQVEAFLKEYFPAGCPPVRHSEAYRANYHPHYRVVKTAYASYLPVFQAVQRLGRDGRPVTVAIDGRCASGKSMLAALLSEVFACSVFHMDDFFLPFHMRTGERLSQPGGNVDRERFTREVLEPLAGGRAISFQPFDCGTGELKPPVHVPAKPVSVVEGSYSHHPAFGDCYDLRILLTCSPEMQLLRLSRREGRNALQRFIKEWIPMEELYFTAFAIGDRCDLKLDTTDFSD